ncbi:hypothetical protein V6Z11_A13G213000 [Gossypium hirsutum]
MLWASIRHSLASKAPLLTSILAKQERIDGGFTRYRCVGARVRVWAGVRRRVCVAAGGYGGQGRGLAAAREREP